MRPRALKFSHMGGHEARDSPMVTATVAAKNTLDMRNLTKDAPSYILTASL